MTELQVIWSVHCLVKQKTFPITKAKKAFGLFYQKMDTQIVLRGVKETYEPSFSSNRIYEDTTYFTKTDYLRKFAKFLRDNKDIINWDNKPVKEAFNIFIQGPPDSKGLRTGSFIRDNENNDVRLFETEDSAKEYAKKQLSSYWTVNIGSQLTW